MSQVNKMRFAFLGGWSSAFGGLTEKAGTAFGAAKTKVTNSFSHQNLSEEAVKVRIPHTCFSFEGSYYLQFNCRGLTHIGSYLSN